MSDSRSDEGLFMMMILGVLVAVALIVWKFSTFFGLNMETGGTVLWHMVKLALLAGFLWWAGDMFDPIRPGNTWPILAALFWACWWPALDYRAGLQYPSFFGEMPTVWWNAWYTKWGIFAAIIALGYGFKKWRDGE